MAQTPNICDCCKQTKEHMQNEEQVRRMLSAFGSVDGHDVPDVCMDCWSDIRAAVEAQLKPGGDPQVA